MLPNLRFVLNSPDVVAEDFDGVTVILNLADGRYFSLGGTGSDLWKCLMLGYSPERLLQAIATQRPEYASDAQRFLLDLIHYKLIRADKAEALSGIDDLMWRGDAPSLSVFSDLMELIHSDPIHDVDEELNWPAQMPTSPDASRR